LATGILRAAVLREDLLGARLLALCFVVAFFAVFAAFFAGFAGFFAGFADFRAAAFFATFLATFFAAVLRRAAGRLAFAAFRAVFRLRVVGLIIVSGSSARVRAGAISVTSLGFTRANRLRSKAYIARAASSIRRGDSTNATSSRVNARAPIVDTDF
jgi:hypothetical protein